MYSVPAKADTTCSYVGAAFTSTYNSVPMTCGAECDLTMSFTVASPLGANFSGIFTPDSFSMTGDNLTITNSNAVYSYLLRFT